MVAVVLLLLPPLEGVCEDVGLCIGVELVEELGIALVLAVEVEDVILKDGDVVLESEVLEDEVVVLLPMVAKGTRSPLIWKVPFPV